MKTNNSIYTLIILIVLLSTSLFAQDVPLLIHYQGNLTDIAGQPLNGTDFGIQFSIWSDETSTAPAHKIWGEELHYPVTIAKGLFCMVLGSIEPLPWDIFATDNLFLEIKIKTETLSPRQKIVSMPYAFTSTTTKRIQGKEIDKAVPATGNVLKWNGNKWAPSVDDTSAAIWQSSENNIYYDSGNVGIGLNSEIVSRLHVYRPSYLLIPGQPPPRLFRVETKTVLMPGEKYCALDVLPGPRVGIGVYDPTHILEIKQNSSTDPVADKWDDYSSKRWKKNIKTIENAMDKVNRLRGVTYNWKADNKKDIGLIAEEVGEVIPEVVVYEKNGTDAKAMNYPHLVSILIEAVKEQQKEIEQLKNEIKDIKK